jgi:hypothetical protein
MDLSHCEESPRISEPRSVSADALSGDLDGDTVLLLSSSHPTLLLRERAGFDGIEFKTNG